MLTKPDRIEPGSELPWISMIRGESNALRHGWFSVKQPSARQLEAGLSWEEARALDRQFFEDTPPWSTIDTEYRHRLGCANLIAHLGETLGKVILTRYDPRNRLLKTLFSCVLSNCVPGCRIYARRLTALLTSTEKLSPPFPLAPRSIH